MSTEQSVLTSDFLTSLFEGASDGLCLVAPDGTVLRANPKWLRSTGFWSEQVVGADILDLFPGSRALAEAVHARARAGERVTVPRHRQVVLGRETWWDGSVAPVRMEGGTGLLITARELPDPAAAQAEAAFAAVRQGILIRAGDGEVLSANEAVRALLELDDDQLRQRAPPPEGWSLVLPDGRSLAELGPEERRRLQAAPTGRYRLRLSGGRTRWLATTSVPLPGIPGHPDAFVMSFLDVTEEQRSFEAALLRAREKELARRVAEIELVVRADGAIVEANDVAVDAYGYSREELLARAVVDLRAEPRAFVVAQLAEAFEKGIRFQTTHRRKDGSTFPVEVSWRSFEVQGETLLHGLVRDLTEARRAEQALAESERRFRWMANSVPALIAESDGPKSLAWANDAWLACTGQTQEEARGAGWQACVHPDDLARIHAAAAAADGRGDDALAFRYRLRGAGGAYRWFQGHLRFLRRKGSGPTGALVTAFDVTEELEAVRRSEASEARLARVLAGSQEGFFDLDPSTGVSSRSDHLARFLGRVPGEIPPTPEGVFALLHPDDRPGFQAEVARVLAGEQEAVDRDVRARHADGTLRRLRVRARLTGPEGGRARYLSGTFTDVTEEHRAREALEGALADLQHALDHVKTLKGLLPICMHCHKIRNDEGYWDRIEQYIGDRTDASFSHALCPECMTKYYPGGR